MPDQPNKTDVIQDNQQGLTLADKTKIRILNQDVVRMLANSGANERVALLVLMNCLGSLLATQFKDLDRVDKLHWAQTMLPLYVKTYQTGEKKI